MTYCTIAEARDAGAVGDDTQVSAAIAEAAGRIDSYTGTIWSTRTLSLVARVEADGAVFLPFVVQSVTAVTPVAPGAPSALPVGSYMVLSSTVLGQVDAVVIGGRGLADPLVLGAEPWAGGYGNLLRASTTGQVTVTGTFGPSDTPATVRQACAALAAFISQGGSILAAPSDTLVNDEGDTVTVTLSVEQVAIRAHTTGLQGVDDVLTPLVRQPIRVG